MKIKRWNHWSIAARLVWITVVPMAALFCTIVSFTYFSRLDEVRTEVIERGNVIATAIAESSEYSLVTGNVEELERISKGFLRSDKSIKGIHVFDTRQRLLFSISSDAPPDKTIPFARAPVYRQVLTVDEFGETGQPHLTPPNNFTAARIAPSVIGEAQVAMSAVRVLDVQRRRLYVQLFVAFTALLASIFVATLLSNTLKRPLQAITAAVNRIQSGRYNIDIPVTSGGEIGSLQSSINEMAISLNESKQSLESKVQERTIELEQSRNEALKANDEKRKLIQKVNTAVEDERKSISVEIHDQLNATLIAAKLNSERIIHLAEQQPTVERSEEIGVCAKSIMALTLELYENARIIVRRLRPEVLDMLGLRGAIEEMVNVYNATYPSCHFQFKENGDCSVLESGLSITIFRLIQESLSNVVKHAGATQAYVTLKVSATANNVRLTILDNGVGSDVSSNTEGIGLIGMKERIYPYNGDFNFSSTPGQGTKITIVLPLLIEPVEDSTEQA
jgi:two-component system sensor histidine kinase UhpB